MSFLDLLITGVLGYQAFKGWQKGFIRLCLELVALIFGLFQAIKHYQAVGTMLHIQFAWPLLLANVGAFLLLWGLIFLGLSLVAWGLDRLISFTLLVVFNKVGGLLLGVIKGAFILWPLLLILQSFQPEMLCTSNLAKFIPSQTILRLLPDFKALLFSKQTAVMPAFDGKVSRILGNTLSSRLSFFINGDGKAYIVPRNIGIVTGSLDG